MRPEVAEQTVAHIGSASIVVRVETAPLAITVGRVSLRAVGREADAAPAVELPTASSSRSEHIGGFQLAAPSAKERFFSAGDPERPPRSRGAEAPVPLVLICAAAGPTQGYPPTRVRPPVELVERLDLAALPARPRFCLDPMHVCGLRPGKRGPTRLLPGREQMFYHIGSRMTRVKGEQIEPRAGSAWAMRGSGASASRSSTASPGHRRRSLARGPERPPRARSQRAGMLMNGMPPLPVTAGILPSHLSTARNWT